MSKIEKGKGLTTSEYKELVPEHSHLEGNPLWDAMTDYLLAHPEYQDTTAFDKMKEQEDRIAQGEIPYKDMAIFIPMGNGKFQKITKEGIENLSIRWKDK